MFKSVLEQLAGRAGFDMTAKWRMASLPYTRRLQGLFQHFGITSVIDVGANAGQFRDQMRHEIGFTGQIFSFEPDPVLADGLLQRAADDPAWTIFSMALGASAGMMPFNVMQNPVFNSFHVPTSEQVGEYQRGNVVMRTVDVPVRTLDTMAEFFPDLAHTYFKVDTQGFDLEVLKGGRDVVRQVPALQTEVSLQQQYAGGPSMQASIDAFAKLGFAIADLFLVSTDGDHRAVEFDCVMVRDRQVT